jgi:hypothetical protein
MIQGCARTWQLLDMGNRATRHGDTLNPEFGLEVDVYRYSISFVPDSLRLAGLDGMLWTIFDLACIMNQYMLRHVDNLQLTMKERNTSRRTMWGKMTDDEHVKTDGRSRPIIFRNVITQREAQNVLGNEHPRSVRKTCVEHHDHSRTSADGRNRYVGGEPFQTI